MTDQFRIGDWSVVPARNHIQKGRIQRKLEPLEMDLLTRLASGNGETVSKDDLLDDVWKQRIVVEHVLPKTISSLRRAFGESAQHPRLIVTVPKRGYRLTSGPHRVTDHPKGTDACRPSLDQPGTFPALAALSIVLILLVFSVSSDSGTGQIPQPSFVKDSPQSFRSSIRNSEMITLESQGVKFSARLWLPEGTGPFPAALSIPDPLATGLQDNSDLGQTPHHLIEMGLAVLELQSRAVRNSDLQQSLLRSLALEAREAINYLADRGDIDSRRIGIWTSRRGASVASMLHTLGVEPRFTIVASSSVVTVDEEMRFRALTDEARRTSAEGTGRMNMAAVYEQMAQGAEGPFEGHDPYFDLEAVSTPTLFLLGEYDLQSPALRNAQRLEELGNRHEWIDYRLFAKANHQLATRDPAGLWYMVEEFYETQADYLANLGIVSGRLKLALRYRMETVAR
jgi:DNA-binding winged helix-turn-helix (wHTH) protein